MSKQIPTMAQRRQIIENLVEMGRRSNGRPWMAVIRMVDGVIQVYEAQPPARIAKEAVTTIPAGTEKRPYGQI